MVRYATKLTLPFRPSLGESIEIAHFKDDIIFENRDRRDKIYSKKIDGPLSDKCLSLL